MNSENYPEPSGAVPEDNFRVADWIVDAAGNRLLQGDRVVRLEPKVMGLLVYLAQHPGRVVSRDELERAVWTGMVVGYDAITNAVIKLRRALGDNSRAPHIIETISKHGYRLIADVGPADLPPSTLPESPSTPAAPSTPATRRQPSVESVKRRRRTAAALLALMLAVAAGTAIIFDGMRQGTKPAPPSAPLPSLAVLPFDDPDAAASRAYFANGLTEDLITDLSKVPGLLVVARNSAFAYKDSDAPDERIGRELGVGFLLRGSVRREAGQLRLNVGLVDVRNAHTVWAERYDRELTDIFRLQDELTARIVAALQIELAPDARRRLSRGEAASVEAYDELLRGNDHYGRRSFEDNELAKAHYERAIALDPGYARAYAALALAYSRDAVEGWAPANRGAMEQAESLILQAVQLDPEVPQIYFILAQVALYRGRHAEAIRHAERAVSLAPGYADAYAMQAWVLHFGGRPARGLQVMERAVRLNPRVPSIYRLVRGALYYAHGMNARAIDDLEQAVSMNPTFQMLRLWLAAAYAGTGRLEDASWQAAEAMALNPDFTLAHIRDVYPISDPDYLERLLHDLRTAGLE
ncbi:MAG: winged helix-turn-helix domain-containing protein [Thiohalocapsa sp.]|nr:winged helix-turn-helix domain-containing protein [Thiohalocapsa sp.]